MFTLQWTLLISVFSTAACKTNWTISCKKLLFLYYFLIKKEEGMCGGYSLVKVTLMRNLLFSWRLSRISSKHCRKKSSQLLTETEYSWILSEYPWCFVRATTAVHLMYSEFRDIEKYYRISDIYLTHKKKKKNHW